MTKLRILLADDHPLMRDGLKKLINAQAGMEVVGEAASGTAAIALAKELTPDIVVMDISMPGVNGLGATGTLTSACPDIRVVVLTRHTDVGHVQELLRAGARGYVLKQSASDELLRAIVKVAAGETYVDPVMAGRALQHMSGRPAVRGSHGMTPLSNREQEVLRLVAWGLLSREIADRLHVSVKTVESHKAKAMTKIGAHSRIDIVRYALLRGWLNDI